MGNCPPAPVGAFPNLKLTPLVQGLDYPMFVTGDPTLPKRLYAVERAGYVRIIDDGVLQPTPFLDISALTQVIINSNQARGLLGLALHPDFAQNGRFYLHYIPAQDGQSIFAEYTRSAADPMVADPSSAKVLLLMDDVQLANHNGGMLAFGHDGMLYASVGDGGGQEDPNENGQNIRSKLGKMLRFDVENHPLPPPDNLPNGNPYVWDYGLRNPWRFSVDRCTGDLYIADVGQYTWEEVNIEPAGQGHKNYGWDEMEGDQCFEPPVGCDMSGVLPVVQYDHTQGCSITGGYVYRGYKIPDLVGAYLYGDFCSNRIWAIRWENGVLTMPPLELTADLDSANLLGGLASFGEDAEGELYVVDLFGTIYRIEGE